ncbi:MAG: rhodanese-like domain-containing protein [Acidimicrobiales bacterium]|nr:rhodanese-like domain-containing protein [Acidimicrobiia bacterium]NNF56111.1 rhodanese-like domain-containing protein [Acidimicrobiales bacterium]
MATSIPQTDTINTAQFRHLLATDPDIRILDVRTGGEFETAHIAGSYNVPLDTLGEHVRDLADTNHPAVLVCQSGARATQAHQKLTDAGKHSLHLLEGGMNAWLADDGDVVHGDTQRWAMDRQVRLAAGSLVLGGVLASLVSPVAVALAGAVGGGLVFSAVSNSCAMGSLLAKLPYNRTDRCDIQGVLDGLNTSAVRV